MNTPEVFNFYGFFQICCEIHSSKSVVSATQTLIELWLKEETARHDDESSGHCFQQEKVQAQARLLIGFVNRVLQNATEAKRQRYILHVCLLGLYIIYRYISVVNTLD